MATTITPATLSVKITESIVLGGVEQGSEHTLSIASIARFSRRIITALTSTNGTELVKLSTAEGAGQFVGSSLKYLRVTNLDDTNYVTLYLEGNSNFASFKLEAGKSFLLGADQLDITEDVDNVTLAAITSIQAKANTASVQLELVTATT